MKRFDMKEHTNKYMKLAKAAGEGNYPNKKVAKIGSQISVGAGGILCCAGIYGLSQNTAIGIGALAAGVLTIISNIINLKRIS